MSHYFVTVSLLTSKCHHCGTVSVLLSLWRHYHDTLLKYTIEGGMCAKTCLPAGNSVNITIPCLTALAVLELQHQGVRKGKTR